MIMWLIYDNTGLICSNVSFFSKCFFFVSGEEGALGKGHSSVGTTLGISGRICAEGTRPVGFFWNFLWEL